MFQATRPLVRWSSVDKRLARRNGGSKDVDAVTPKVKFLVTAAMADIGYQGARISEVHYWGLDA